MPNASTKQNSPTRWIFVAALVLGALGLWTLWRTPRSAPQQERAAIATRAAPARAGGSVIARVEGQPIYESELREAVTLLVALGETGELVRIDDADGDELRVSTGAERALCADLLVRFVYDELARQEAAARRIVFDEAAIQRALATTEAAYEDPAAIATTEAHLRSRTGLSEAEYEQIQLDQQRTDMWRRSVNTILRTELDTEDRSVVDAWWEERWASAEIEWQPEVCATLYP